MSLVYVIPYYFAWHYSQALLDIKNLFKSFLLFIYHFFSISLLFSTLFQPWRRTGDDYKVSQYNFLETIIFNTIMRVVGAVLRLVIVFAGLLTLVFCFVLGLALVFIWLLLPVLWVYLIYIGIDKSF